MSTNSVNYDKTNTVHSIFLGDDQELKKQKTSGELTPYDNPNKEDSNREERINNLFDFTFPELPEIVEELPPVQRQEDEISEERINTIFNSTKLKINQFFSDSRCEFTNLIEMLEEEKLHPMESANSDYFQFIKLKFLETAAQYFTNTSSNFQFFKYAVENIVLEKKPEQETNSFFIHISNNISFARYDIIKNVLVKMDKEYEEYFPEKAPRNKAFAKPFLNLLIKKLNINFIDPSKNNKIKEILKNIISQPKIIIGEKNLAKINEFLNEMKVEDDQKVLEKIKFEFSHSLLKFQ